MSVALVTRDKEICQSHVIMRCRRQYPLRWSTQWNPLNEVYLLSEFHVSSFSITEDNIDFQTGHLADFDQVNIIKSKLTLLVYFYYFGQVTIILLSLGKTLGHKKQFKPSCDKKFKNHAQDLAQVIYNDVISGNEELGSPVNKQLQRFNLLFLSVTRFSNFEILQLRAKFQTATVLCSRFIWITNSSDRRRV